MTDTPDNAGARLFSIVSRLKEHGGQQPLRAWALALDIPDRPVVSASQVVTVTANAVEDFDVIHGINETGKLIAEVERKIRSIKDIKLNRYLGPFPRIYAVVNLQTLVTGQFHNALSAVSEGDLTVLDFCAEALERHYKEPVVDQGQLKELLQDIDALFQGVSDSEIDPDLKLFLLARAEEMRRGVVEYQIGGHERLKEALGKTFGMIMVNRDLIEAHKDDPAIKSFSNVTGRMASLVAFTSNVASLVESAMKLLPGG